jgi:dihydroorotase
MILIKNGRVVCPVSHLDEIRDVLIDGNRIIHVAESIEADSLRNVKVIDATGMVVSPGLFDGHVHFRDPGFTEKEDIATGARAAAKGGITTVICMANTKPPVDNIETLHYVQKKGEMTGIHVLSAANISKGMRGKELVDMESLSNEGAAVFTDDGLPIMDEKLLYKAMERARELDIPISLHEEDPAFVYQAGVNKGIISDKLNYGGAQSVAEDVMVARDCALALHTGASVCIQHISSGNSVEIIRGFKKLGADIHAEATPHHFTLKEDYVLFKGTNARMNPPLRTEKDRIKIIGGLQDGTIDMIATDHAPHTKEEKERSMDKAPSGVIGLETSLALGIKSLVEPGYITLMQLIECMSTNPARFYRLVPGSIAEDSYADIVIFGEHDSWTAGDYVSKSENSPFTGWELPGKIYYTICNGKIVYEA